MSIDKTQLRELIVDVLHYLSPEIPYSENAVNLLMLTAAQESHLGTYIKQIKGPARGIFQMEPATERDIYDNFLAYKPQIASKIRALTTDDGPDNLLSNLAYQIAMARVHYFRSPRALGSQTTEWAATWKAVYNTPLGKGTEQEAIANYLRLC